VVGVLDDMTTGLPAVATWVLTVLTQWWENLSEIFAGKGRSFPALVQLTTGQQASLVVVLPNSY